MPSVARYQSRDHEPNGPARWHNHLPTWIIEAAAYKDASPARRAVLQSICNACDAEPDGYGSLTGAFGGAARFSKLAGCSVRTFWRHLLALERYGFVVCLGVGGPHGMRNTANAYGIPGTATALDHRRVRRTYQQMLPWTDHKRRPQTTGVGQQATLIPRGEMIPRRAQTDPHPPRVHQDRGPVYHRAGPQSARRASPLSGDTPTPITGPIDHVDQIEPQSERDGISQVAVISCPKSRVTSDKMSLPPCQTGTPPSPYHLPKKQQNHGCGAVPASQRRNKDTGGAPPDHTGRSPETAPSGKTTHRGKTLPHVTRDDLVDAERLGQLMLAAADRGLIGRSEHDVLNFYAAAAHALRLGSHPPALFASLINRGQFLFLAECDFDAANAQLKAYRYGITPRRRDRRDEGPL